MKRHLAAAAAAAGADGSEDEGNGDEGSGQQVAAAAAKRARVDAAAAALAAAVAAAGRPALKLQPGSALRRGGWTDLGGGARVAYFPALLAEMDRGGAALKELLQLPWEQVGSAPGPGPLAAPRCTAHARPRLAAPQHNLVLFGKPVAQPRLILYMGDQGSELDLTMTYTGLSLQPKPWTKVGRARCARCRAVRAVVAGGRTERPRAAGGPHRAPCLPRPPLRAARRSSCGRSRRPSSS